MALATQHWLRSLPNATDLPHSIAWGRLRDIADGPFILTVPLPISAPATAMDTRLGKTGLSVMALICLIRCGSSDASTTTSSRADLAATQAIELSGMNNSDPALLPVMGRPYMRAMPRWIFPDLARRSAIWTWP